MQNFEMTPEEIRQKIDNMIWSFSRVNSSGCLYSFYLSYIEEQKGAENAFAQFGTACHETLEKYLKGELDMFSVLPYYQQRFNELVTYDFPSNKYVDLREKAYTAGEEYFSCIDFDFDKYEVLGVEKEYRFNVGKYPFKGFIDALYRNKETGEIIIRDHKTSSFKYLKSGEVSKTDAEHFLSFRRQELLYSIPVLEEYGRVDYLSWNMIRDKRIIQIPFNQDELNETIEWCKERIHTLEEEVLWLPDNKNSYFCNVLCSNRSFCPYRPTGG